MLAFYSICASEAALQSHLITVPASRVCSPEWKRERPKGNRGRSSHPKGASSPCSWLSSVRKTRNSDYWFFTHPQPSEWFGKPHSDWAVGAIPCASIWQDKLSSPLRRFVEMENSCVSGRGLGQEGHSQGQAEPPLSIEEADGLTLENIQ